MQTEQKDVNRRKKRRRIPIFIGIFLGLFVVLPAAYWLYFFKIRLNFTEVVDQKVYKSGQPDVNRLRKWVQKYNIQTVINLRGDAGSITQEEEKILSEMGVQFLTFKLSAYYLPRKKTMLNLIDSMEKIQTPVLIHCCDGVDRSGTVSAIAAMAIGGQSYDDAVWYSYVPPGPWKRKAKRNYVHISDLFDMYEEYLQNQEEPAGGWEHFKGWLREHYERPPENTTHMKKSEPYSIHIPHDNRHGPVGVLRRAA